MKRIVAALAVATALGAAAQGHAATAAGRSTISLLRDGKPAAVPRAAPTLTSVVRSLLAGPTPLEQARGFSTTIPRGTQLRSVSVTRRVVTVDLAARFATGRDDASLHERVSQLVRTVRSIPGVLAVRVRIEGGVPIGLFPGYDLQRPVTAASDPVTHAPGVRDYQQLLADLGYMAPSGITGAVDSQTSTAVLGFEKWSGLPRDGVLGDAVESALLRATRPQPVYRAPGRRIEVLTDRQVALLIEDNRVVRTVHISSGAYGKTPLGSYRVYRKERYSWSVPFKVWLPWASYFTGGVAFHEFGSVPTYAASHGCIRVNHYDAQMLYGFAEMGTPVRVFDARSAA